MGLSNNVTNVTNEKIYSAYKFVSLKAKLKKQKRIQRKQKKKKKKIWIFQCGHFVALYSCPGQKFNTMAYFVHSGDLI